MPDADADHRGQDRGREALERVHVGEQADDRQSDGEAGQRHHDRQGHGQHRSEGDQQDDDGGQDADAARSKAGGWRSDCWMSWPPRRTSSCGGRVLLGQRDHLLADRVGDVVATWSSSCSVGQRDRPGPRDGARRGVGIADAGDVGRPRPSSAMNAFACRSTAASCIDGVPFITTWTLVARLGLEVGRQQVRTPGWTRCSGR